MKKKITQKVEEKPSSNIIKTKLPDGNWSVKIEDKEYFVKYMPDGNEWVPWVLFLYKFPDGNWRGTTGQGYVSAESAIDYAEKFHFYAPMNGWLNPDGKFYEVAYSQHSLIVELFYPKANGEYETLFKQGWIIMRHGRFDADFNWEVEITTKQYNWIENWSKKYNLPMPIMSKHGTIKSHEF